MIIISNNGVIDTSGCRIHVAKGNGSSTHSELPVTDEGYNLTVTNLESGFECVVEHTSSEKWANARLNGIIEAVKEGHKCYDLTDSMGDPNKE